MGRRKATNTSIQVIGLALLANLYGTAAVAQDRGTVELTALVAATRVDALPEATIVVDNTTCTLIDAINSANTDTAVGGCPAGSGADTIELTADVTVTEEIYPGASLGLPTIESDITIEGGGFTIERDPPASDFILLRVWHGFLTLNHVTLRNGRSPYGGGAIHTGFSTLIVENSALIDNLADDDGGAILAYESNVWMSHCNLSNNYAGQWGGAISVVASRDRYSVTVSHCILSGNSARAGGGISINRAELILSDSTVSDNTASAGGGIFNSSGWVSIASSTVSNNWAWYGGGGLNGGEHDSITNSTISGNSASRGGGVAAGNHLTITNSTLSGNSAVNGGGGIWPWRANPADVTLTNTIVAHNASGGNCHEISGQLVDGGGNFADDDSCGAGFSPITPGVDYDIFLADNGGPTLTHALLRGSVAIDAGGYSSCPPTDQRSVLRPLDGNGDGTAECDGGAYEYENPVISLDLDIKPDDFPNSVNPSSRGVIPVAILGSNTFDVADIDEATLRFGPDAAPIAHRHAHFEDASLDGFMDLVIHLRTQETGIACGDESATLTGETLDGQPIEGSDSISTVGCRVTRRPAIWMKDRDRLGNPRSDGPVNIERK